MNPDQATYKWWIALTVVPAGLISAVDSTSVSIAIPNMMTSLRADLDQIQWVVTISLIMQTLLMPAAGWLSGVLARRDLFVSSLGIICLGTILCMFAWSLESLVFFRAILGFGAGILQPISITLLYGAFPAHQRGTAMGLFNTSVALGLIIGRFGGFLIDAFDWRMIFLLTLPFSVGSAILGFFTIPRLRQPGQWSIDIWGIISMGGFLIPLLVALTQGRFEGWDSAYIRSLFANSIASFFAFITIELRSKTPLVDLRLYRHVNFALGSLLQFLVMILFSSSTFLLNIFLQRVYHYTPSQVGLLMLPQGIVYGLGSMWAGRLSDYVNPRLPMVFGLICFSIVYYWLGSITVFATAMIIMSMLCLRSFSFSCVNSPNTLLTLRALPEDKVSMGSGLFSVARGIAGTLGVAISAAFLEHRRTIHATQLAQQQGLIELPAQWTLSGLRHTFSGAGDIASLAQTKALAHLHQMMLAEATTAAYQDIFLISAFISVFNLLPALLRRRAAIATPQPTRAQAAVPRTTPADSSRQS
jgi:EmrB/QacA subfamily drug resistance transporter